MKFSFENVALAGVGYAMPPKVLSSRAIEDLLAPVYSRIGLHPGRLELMTGIIERRHFEDGTAPSAAATWAGRDALQRSGIDSARIGAVVHASVCRDFLEPASANLVHEALRLPPSAMVLDVSNACLGVMNGIALVGTMIESGQIDAGLVVAGEIGKPLTDTTIRTLLEDETITRKSIKPAFASLTIGSGAAGVVLARRDLAVDSARVNGGVFLAATEHNRLCRGDVAGEGGLQMETDSEALLHAGIALARTTWTEFQSGARASFDAVITHQVGKGHHRALLAALEIPEHRSFVTYDRLGNVGSVSLPISLALAAEAGHVAKGQQVALLGIGSGLSCAMMRVSW